MYFVNCCLHIIAIFENNFSILVSATDVVTVLRLKQKDGFGGMHLLNLIDDLFRVLNDVGLLTFC